MKNNRKTNFTNSIAPVAFFGAITGIFTAIIIILFKVCAGKIILFSEHSYAFLKENISFVPVAVLIVALVALFFSLCYKRFPYLSGGGIPTSIGILRGIVPLKWVISLFGVFILSLLSFFTGVPLGTEGPSVQMGTSAGKGSTCIFSKKYKALERYSMTSGACAGFSVATGAPISGILFSLEEAHQRFSPMIIIVSATSVTFSYITAELLSPLFSVSSKMFPTLTLSVLKINDIWIPLVIGVVSGLFAVIFLNYYKAINAFFNKALKNIPPAVKIFIILLLTLVAGLFSFDYISTGHELMLEIMENKLPILTLVLLLLVRSTLTLGANSNRITGGVFIPILTIGVVLAAIFANVAESFFGLKDEYYVIILVLGITSCISGMMKMPLTAIAFSVEALGSYNNILFVITASISAFIITEIFDTQSINDTVLHNKIEEQNKNKTQKVIDTFVTVQMDSFAVGKQIRDIFWPANLFVLSIKHSEESNAKIDEHGGKYIKANDILHIRYSTLDEELTKNELFAIVGMQDFHENEDKNV